MSTTTFLGLLIGILLFIGSILMATDNVLIFISVPSIILVLGGTLANGFMSYQGPYVVKALKSTWGILSHARTNETILVGEAERVVEWSRIVSTQGQVALEQHIKAKGNDELLTAAGLSREEISEIENTATQVRDNIQQELLKVAAAAAVYQPDY